MSQRTGEEQIKSGNSISFEKSPETKFTQKSSMFMLKG